jgi:hypothetical protein
VSSLFVFLFFLVFRFRTVVARRSNLVEIK